MESLNRLSTELIDEAIDFADELLIEVQSLPGESMVLDFGVEVPGAIEAGLLLAEIQTAGLSTVQTRVDELAGAPFTHVELSTDQPALSLLCASKAGWEISAENFEGLGSGPARALVGQEDIFQQIGYREQSDFGVLVLESDTLPGSDVAADVAERAGVPESGVFLPTYASASITGSVMGASRAAELAVYRLTELGYDPMDILSATGSAPVAPVSDSESEAMAMTNDAIAYGGQVHLAVEEPFDEFEEIASTASDQHGRPFAEIFESVEYDYSELDRSIFAPASVTVDVVGGDTHVVGETAEDVLVDSFGLSP